METSKRMRTRVGDDLVTLFGIGAIGRLSDAELLARFLRRHDAASSEAAFSAMVSRHGPMILGVCRRMLRDEHAAADAFQAVFLVLARKAPSVQVDDSLGGWLHGVSVRVARRARAVMHAERARTQALDGLDPPDESAEKEPRCGFEVRAAIDEEIARLPGRYRSAVVLCYLEGLTQEQAARGSAARSGPSRAGCIAPASVCGRRWRDVGSPPPPGARRPWHERTCPRHWPPRRPPGFDWRATRRPGWSRPPSPGWRHRRSGGWR